MSRRKVQKNRMFRKHQSIIRDTPVHMRPTTRGALQFLPGNDSLSCLHDPRDGRPEDAPTRFYRSLSDVVIMVQTSGEVMRNGRNCEYIPTRGYYAGVESVNENVFVGRAPDGDDNVGFAVDAGVAPWPHTSQEGILDATDIPLVTAVYEGYKRRCRSLTVKAERTNVKLPLAKMQFPTILAGYALGTVPMRVDSIAFRARLCQYMERAVGSSTDDVPEKVKEELWFSEAKHSRHRSIVIDPTAPDNNTGYFLIPLEYLIPYYEGESERSFQQLLGGAKDKFWDLKPLCGENYHNPVKLLRNKADECRVPNPAKAVLVALDKDPADPNVTLDEFECELFCEIFRDKFDSVLPISDEQIGAALDARDAPVVLSAKNVLDVYSEKRALQLMRRGLSPVISGAASDVDLLSAARYPGNPLNLSGMVKTQIFACKPAEVYTPDPFQFMIDRNYSLCVDLWSVGGEPDEAATLTEEASCQNDSSHQMA